MARFKKSFQTGVGVAVLIILGGASFAVAAVTISGTSITGDSSFNAFTGGASTTLDIGAGTLSIQTTNNGPITLGSGLLTFTSASGTNVGLTGYLYGLATTTIGSSTPVSSTAIFGVATTSPLFWVNVGTNQTVINNASTSNVSSTNQTIGGYLVVTGQSTVGNASGTNVGLTGYDYTLGNLGVGTTTTSNLLFLATSSPILVVSSTGQIMIATTSIPQAGALFTVATSSNILSVLPGAVNVSTTLSVTGQTTLVNASGTNVGLTGYLYSANASTSNVSSTNQTIGGYLVVTGQSTFGNASGTNLGLSGYLYANTASTTNQSSTNITVANNLQVLGTFVPTNVSSTALSDSGYGYFLGNLGVGTTTTSNLLFMATSTPILVASSTGQIMIATTSIPQAGALLTIATTTNILSVLPGAVNVSTTLSVTGQTTLVNASGTNAGLTGYDYTLGNLGVGTTTTSNLLFLATSSPILVASSTGQIMIATTSIPQAGALLTIATTTNILSVLPGAVNVSTTLSVTGQTTLVNASGTNAGLSGYTYALGTASVATTSASNLFQVATGTTIFLASSTGVVQAGFHLGVATTTANTPTTGTCGTGSKVQGSDIAGVITVGTGGTQSQCTLIFGTKYQFNPAVVISGSYASTTLNVFQASTTGFVASSSAPFPSEVLYYTVMGNPY